MSEQNPRVRGFETRLASLDRRLAAIQQELAPESDRRAEPAGAEADRWDERPGKGEPDAGHGPAARAQPDAGHAPAASAGPAPPERPRAVGPEWPLAAPPPREDSELLHGLYVSLLASNRRLLDGYEEALARLSGARGPGPAPPRAPGPAPPRAPEGPPADEATLSAGPFASTGSLHRFERVLGGLPDVREVELRGYESGNRAILDVRLAEETT
jgi:hypothetical protein